MPPAPPSERELDAYREQADRFIAELDEEYYLHYAGLKETFELGPIYVDSVRIEQRAVRELGAPTYLDLYRKFGFDVDDLAEQCRAFLDSTERLYEESADRLFRDRVGVGLSEVKRWDVARVFRATSWDEAFPKNLMLP